MIVRVITIFLGAPFFMPHSVLVKLHKLQMRTVMIHEKSG